MFFSFYIVFFFISSYIPPISLPTNKHKSIKMQENQKKKRFLNAPADDWDEDDGEATKNVMKFVFCGTETSVSAALTSKIITKCVCGCDGLHLLRSEAEFMPIWLNRLSAESTFSICSSTPLQSSAGSSIDLYLSMGNCLCRNDSIMRKWCFMMTDVRRRQKDAGKREQPRLHLSRPLKCTSANQVERKEESQFVPLGSVIISD